jgi:hypothetical protein
LGQDAFGSLQAANQSLKTFKERCEICWCPFFGICFLRDDWVYLLIIVIICYLLIICWLFVDYLLIICWCLLDICWYCQSFRIGFVHVLLDAIRFEGLLKCCLTFDLKLSYVGIVGRFLPGLWVNSCRFGFWKCPL